MNKAESSPPNNKIRRILLIAYYYPPLGGPASIRLGKTVKYLKEEGFEVDVVTVKNILYHSYDYDLAEECNPDKVVYASSFGVMTIIFIIRRVFNILKKVLSIHSKSDTPKSNGTDNKGQGLYFIFPEKLRSFIKNIIPVDDKLLWFYPARNAALKLLRRKKHDLIFVSIAPYTAGLVGYSLSKMTNVPLLIDYRDHWTLNPYGSFLSFFHKQIAVSFERKMLSQAAYLTCIGTTMKRELQESFSGFFPNLSEVIYNGYDEADFTNIDAEKNNNFWTLTYTGNFYQQRTPYFFCQALLSLKRQQLLPKDIKVQFIGNYHRDAETILKDKNLEGIVKVVNYLPHKGSIRELMKSDVLLLFIPSVDGKGVLTSKVFEYLRSGKPILAMIPEESELSSIMAGDKYHICHPENTEQIADGILRLYSHFKENQGETADNDISQYNCYSRREQTMKLIKLINRNN